MQRKGLEDGDTWISTTDLMSGLMVMFLLIAMAFMKQLQEKDPLEAHRIMEANIFNELSQTFNRDIQEQVISVDSSLALRFIDGNIRMFDAGEKRLRPEFMQRLDSVLPKYLELVTRDTVLRSIAEIRVEGHANSDPNPEYCARHWTQYPDSLFPDSVAKAIYLSYAFNSELSQGRAREVLDYIRSRPVYRRYPKSTRDRLDFLFTATGMSFARRLDSNGNLVYTSEGKEDLQRSLRVEFRIVTSRPEGLSDVLKQLNSSR